MSLSIAGTICFDTIETPTERIERTLGGSGVFATVAAALHSQPHLIGAVGSDFTAEARQLLDGRGIDLRGVATIADVRTQFWHGRYSPGLHTREHLAVDLDIFDRMDPIVPPELRGSSHVFLAHMPPHLQNRILDQLSGENFILADTIDHWIAMREPEVKRMLGRVTAAVVNDGEAELLTGECDALRAARAIVRMGPKLAIVKKGEHGVLILTEDDFIALPAYPTECAIDPTGAGDTFAGTLIASLEAGQSLVRSAANGVVAASATVEGFGLRGLLTLTPAEHQRRLQRYRAMLSF